MSDLQDLIHKTSIDCIEKGQRMEQERIIKLLKSTADCRCTPNNPDWDNTCFCDAIELINGGN